MSVRYDLLPAATALPALADQWDAAAERAGSPFVTTQWLIAWTAARGPSTRCLVVREGDRLLAGACIQRRGLGGLAAAADVHSGVWTVVGDRPDLAWTWLAGRATGLRAHSLPPTDAALAAEVLGRRHRVVLRKVLTGPRLELPASPEALLASRSRDLRSQYRRKRKALAALGPLRLRTSSGPEVEADLRRFLELEHAGWKHDSGTSILSDASTTRLYTEFARAAAKAGTLRLQLLEVGDRAVAGDLSCSVGGTVHMIKTTYDEELRQHSPGLVLRGEALLSAISDGFHGYDFLGGPEPYKLRWGGSPQTRMTLWAARGPASWVGHPYHALLRPRLVELRNSVRARRATRT